MCGGGGWGGLVCGCSFVCLFCFVIFVVVVVLIRAVCGVYYLFMWIIWCFGAQMDHMVFRSSYVDYSVAEGLGPGPRNVCKTTRLYWLANL